MNGNLGYEHIMAYIREGPHQSSVHSLKLKAKHCLCVQSVKLGYELTVLLRGAKCTSHNVSQ